MISDGSFTYFAKYFYQQNNNATTRFVHLFVIVNNAIL